MSDKKVRVRFAPSPTGPLHMGGVRTALYNYLFAKHHGGDFILRVEDTDQTRFVPGAMEYIIESLKWCGIEPDEGQGFADKGYGPYLQSERKDQGLYKKYVEQLLASGHAYYAFDTSEELTEMRERLTRAKVVAPKYNHVTRPTMKNSLSLPQEEVQRRLEAGDDYVVRIKFNKDEEIRFHDEIRGWIVVNTDSLDDKVLMKSDGMPTYHMANIVDDHLMEITHVIRGEEWLPSLPLHVYLYRCLGWEETMPKFAHLPLILKPDGNGKLSKRDGDRLGFPVFPLEWQDPATQEISSGYKQKGYYPDAFINMLSLLGWNPGDNSEIMSKAELIEKFTLNRVGKAGAKFDADKTLWFNQQYLRMQSAAELAEEMKPLLTEKGITVPAHVDLAKVAELMKERAVFVKDLCEDLYFYNAPDQYDEKTIKKKWKENTPEHMTLLANAFEAVNEWNAAEIEKAFKDFMQAQELGMGSLLPNFRVLLTGLGMGPSMFEIAFILGKEETLKRMREGIEKLK